MFKHNTLHMIKNLKKQLYFLAVLSSLDGHDADYGSVCYCASFSQVLLQGLMIIVSEWAKVNTRGFFPAVFVPFLTAANVCPPWTRYSVVLMQIAVPLHIWLPALLCLTPRALETWRNATIMFPRHAVVHEVIGFSCIWWMFSSCLQKACSYSLTDSD